MKGTILPLFALIGLTVWNVAAQSDPSTPPDSGTPPDVIQPGDPSTDNPGGVEQPPLEPPPTPEPPTKPEPPTPPERPSTPARPDGVNDLQALIKEFKAAREAFVKERLETVKQLKAASAEERAAIRETFKQSLTEWREAQRQHVVELRQAAKEIKETVGSVSEIVDSARAEGRNR